jgi:hypothetical protein
MSINFGQELMRNEGAALGVWKGGGIDVPLLLGAIGLAMSPAARRVVVMGMENCIVIEQVVRMRRF